MTGIVMVVNVLPVPGINALIVPDLSAAMGLTTTTEQSQLTAALTLFRVCTWILPMIIGVGMFFVWRYRVRKDTVTTVNTDTSDDGGWDPIDRGGDPADPGASAGGGPAVPGNAQGDEDRQQHEAPED